MDSGFQFSDAFVAHYSDKERRDAFVADQVRTRIALMIRALREQEGRGWSQEQLGDRMGDKPQSVISRLENPDYGKLSVKTLLEAAAAFDLPLRIDIPEWRDWFAMLRESSDQSFHRQSFSAEALRAPPTETVVFDVSSTGEVRSELSAKASPNWHLGAVLIVNEETLDEAKNEGVRVRA